MVIYHLIHVPTRILEISSTRDDIDGIASLPMTLRSMATTPRIHKTRWVLNSVYTFCKHQPCTYRLIDVSTRILEISSRRDDIDGISPSSTTLRSTLVLPKSTKQGEFGFLCIHFASCGLKLTIWSMYPHGFWKYRPRGTIWTEFHHCRQRCCCFSCCSVFDLTAI